MNICDHFFPIPSITKGNTNYLRSILDKTFLESGSPGVLPVDTSVCDYCELSQCSAFRLEANEGNRAT